MKKRLLVSLFSGFILCLAAQSAVWATAEPIKDPETGNNSTVTWELSNGNATLTIDGTGAMPDFSSTGDNPWNSNKDSIKSVTIGNGVTGIGRDAFFEHTALTSATIGTGVKSIGQMAFKGTGLTSIDLKNVEEIGDSAFSGCTSLDSITLDGVKKIGAYVFNGCTSLKYIDLEGVKTIGASAFNGCTSLEYIDLKGVKTIGDGAFSGCTALALVVLPCETVIVEGAFGDATVNKHHALETVGPTPATCTTPEISIYKRCQKCGQLFADASTLTSLGKDLQNFTSCTHSDDLTYYEVEESDLENGDPLNYELDFVPAKAGTCIEKGTKEHYVCKTCGGKFTREELEGTAVALAFDSRQSPDDLTTYHMSEGDGKIYIYKETDVEGEYGPHQYGELIKKVPATCVKNGCEAHYECEVCGGKFVIAISEDGKKTYKEVNGKDLIIPATGHSYGEWEITKAPTTTSEGEKTRKCSICDSAETDVIPKLAEEKTSGVVSSAATTYGYAVDTGDFVSGEMLAYAYSLCVSGMAFVSLRKKKSKV